MRSMMLLMGVMVTANLAACAASHAPRYVYYSVGSDQPRSSDDAGQVSSTISTLRDDPSLNVALIGYASSDGTAEVNQVLSYRRAERVRDQLVQAGVAASRITIAARGQDHPAAPNTTEQGRALNRRVEMFFYYPSRGALQTQYGVHIDVRR